jgi:ATP-binding cassette subfamily B protein
MNSLCTTITSAPDLTKGIAMPVSLKEIRALLFSYLKPQRGRIILLALLLFSGIALQVINPQLVGYLINTATTGKATTSRLVSLALLFLILSIITQVLSIYTTYLSSDVAWTATNALRNDLAARCLSLSMAFHNAHTPGEFIERIDSDVTALANFFSQFVLLLLGCALLLLGVLVALYLENWRVGGVFSLFTVLTLLMLYRFRHTASPYWAAERQTSAEMYGFLEERLSGIFDLRANGIAAYTMNLFYRLQREQLFKNFRARFTSESIIVFSDAIFTLGYLASFALGTYLFLHRMMSLGSVYLIIYYSGLLFIPMVQIAFQMDDMQKALASIQRITALYNTRDTLQKCGTLPLPTGALSVTFDNVSFCYGEGEPALKNISFHLPAGKVLGLLGRSGSGKTTLIRLLLHLYELTEGSILLNGIELRNIHQDAIGNSIGIVTQDIQLFHATIRDNLTFFDRQISDQQIMQAVERAGLADWFAALPSSLDTMLGAGGSGVSAGEAQLIALLRVFLKNPGLIIFDEASSRLDLVTERRIAQAMKMLLQGRTGIIIAHHLATVEQADNIMVLENGILCEYGPRLQLAQDGNSHYARLLQTGAKEILA